MVVLRLPDSWSNWNLEVLAFEERGKPEYPGEKPLAIWIYSPGPWSLVRAIVEQTGRLKSARSTKIYMTIKWHCISKFFYASPEEHKFLLGLDSVLINLSLWLRWWWCNKTRLFQIFHYKQITIRNRNFDHTKMFQIYTVSYIFLYVNIFTSITYFLTSTPTVLLFKFDLS